MTRSISLCRPITGSSSLFFARSVRSRPNARKAGVLTSFFRRRFATAILIRFRRREIGIEFLQNFVAGTLDIDFEILEHAGRDAFAFAQETEQNMFGADVRMIQRLGFLPSEREHFLHARRVRNVADHFCLRTGPNLLLDFHPHGFEIEPHLLEHVHGHALSELDQPEQQMLGADVIVVEAIGLLARERQNLLCSRSKSYSSAFSSEPFPSVDPRATLLISGLGKSFKRSRIICARRKSRSSAFSFCWEPF